MADFGGTPGADTHSGDLNDDSISGLAGRDVLLGAGGNDTILGGDDADILDGGLGDDLLDGGAGFDQVRFADAAAGVDVDLGVQGVGVTQNAGLGVDTLIDIEGVAGTAYSDTLAGDDGDNWIWSGADNQGFGGDDVLTGGDGADLIVVAAGDHFVDGGAGEGDTLSFTVDPSTPSLNVVGSAFVSLDWQGGAAQLTGHGQMDIVGFENLSGSSFDDWLQGDEGANVLAGGLGADELEGGEGADLLLGDGWIGLGADGATTHEDAGGISGSGDDTLTGGAGDDTIIGGDGIDVAVFSGARADYTFVEDESEVLITHNGGGVDAFDTLIGVEVLQFADMTISLQAGTSIGTSAGDAWTGGSGAETYLGLAGDDTLAGAGGDDALQGGDDDDRLTGGAGNDTLNGGNGDDTADYAGAAGAVNVSLDGGEASGAAGADTLVDVENVVGSSFADEISGDSGWNTLSAGDGDDAVFGRNGADSLAGDAGMDHLDGGEGDDTLAGGADDDVLVGGEGLDVLTGGDGVDTASYAYAPEKVLANLETGFASGSFGDEDSLTGIENLTGSDNDDTLIGDGGVNILEGGAGDDSLDGGAGNDFVSYAAATGGVVVDLDLPGAQPGGGGMGQDTLTDIEGVIGSAHNDTLVSGPGSVTLDGGAGDDRIFVATGSGDTSRVTLGEGADTLAVSATTTGTTVVADFEAGEDGDALDLTQILDQATDWNGTDNPFEENYLRLVQDEADTLVQLNADAAGAGTEFATLLRLEDTDSLALTLDNLGVGAPTEVTGGEADDVFNWTPTTPAESIVGGGGLDILNIFQPVFEAVEAIFSAGPGGLAVAFNNFATVFINAIEEVFFRVTNLVVDGFLGGFGLLFDTIHYEGTPGDDNTLDASAMTSTHSIAAQGLDGADTLVSAGGNDSLDGGAGADSLAGGGDNDTLLGGAGNDALDGGAGSLDVAIFAGDRADYTVTALGGGQVEVSGADGVDTLTGVERLRFDDTTTNGLGAALSGGSGGGNGGGGSSAPTPTAGADLLMLGSTADSVQAGEGADTVSGGDGDDFVHGNTGADSLSGGAGNDSLRGGQGDDQVYGDAGADLLFGDLGRNVLRGGDGEDLLYGGDDFDDAHGNIGDDTVHGGGGDDWVVGGQNQDLLFGEDGGDVVLGNLGEDTASGGGGNDVIRGGQGSDVVNGDDGDDWLAGDRGDDTLSGGAGADVFHSWGEAGVDRVLDFSFAEGDRVNLLGGTTYAVAQVGADTVVSMTGGGEMTLVGVQMSSLQDGWITVG